MSDTDKYARLKRLIVCRDCVNDIPCVSCAPGKQFDDLLADLDAANAQCRCVAGLRPMVREFAALMESRMRVGDGRGWTMDGVTAESLAARARQNLGNGIAYERHGDTRHADECFADTANLVMLIAAAREAVK